MNVFLFFSYICSYSKKWEKNKKILRGFREICTDSQVCSYPPEYVDESRLILNLQLA